MKRTIGVLSVALLLGTGLAVSQSAQAAVPSNCPKPVRDNVSLAKDLPRQAQINLLRNAPSSWNEMRPQLIKAQPQLSGAELNFANLSGLNLSGADLFGAHLRYADLTGTNLRCADLEAADITEAKINGVVLTDADVQRLIRG